MPQPLELEVERPCLRPAIPEIAIAAKYLDDAVSAHMVHQPELAAELIQNANMPVIRDWVESLWGKASPYVQYRLVIDAPLHRKLEEREQVRMPNSAEKLLLHIRDGYHCRFCGIPVVRKEIRYSLQTLYPNALHWGSKNIMQHAAFQAMWLQYDHILPHARGGTNLLENIIVTCGPCNFGRMQYTLAEVGLADPRLREPIRSQWDGLERLLGRSSSL